MNLPKEQVILQLEVGMIAALLGLSLFARAYGGNGSEEFAAFAEVPGGYLLVGKTNSFGSGGYDAFLVKVDFGGNLIWAKTLGGSGGDFAYDVLVTSDGGYLVLGSTSSSGNGGQDVMLAKFSASDSLEWLRVYGGSRDEEGFSVIEVPGGYVVAGYTTSFGGGQKDVLIFEVDPLGNPQWAATFGGNKNDEALSVVRTPGGELRVVGYTWSFGVGQSDVLLLAFGPGGNLNWFKTYGGNNIDEAYSAVLTGSGELLVGGSTWSFGARQNDLLVMKLDLSGGVVWSTMIGGNNGDEALWVSLALGSGGDALVVGYTWDLGIGNGDFFAVKLSALGELEWATSFGGGNSDFAYSAQRVSDGYAIAGYSWSFGLGQKDAFLLKIDSSGEYSGCVLRLTPTVSHPEVEVTSPPFAAARALHLPSSAASLNLVQQDIDWVDACEPLYWDVCEGTGAAPLRWRQVSGGVAFVASHPAELRIYSPNGRLIRRLNLVKGENFVPLKPGLYFWSAAPYRGKLVIR